MWGVDVGIELGLAQWFLTLDCLRPRIKHNLVIQNTKYKNSTDYGDVNVNAPDPPDD